MLRWERGMAKEALFVLLCLVLSLGFWVNNYILNSNSQAKQDLYASIVCDRRDGFFLDLGCRFPINDNNTFALENELNWSGILIDIDRYCMDLCANTRRNNNSYVCVDLTKIKIAEILEHCNCPEWIDYISFDVDDASTAVFDQFDFDKYTFGFMTFEHDAYRIGDSLRTIARNKLNDYDYCLFRENVMPGGNSYSAPKCPSVNVTGDVAGGGQFFEDWYIHNSLLEKS